ncbi:iron chaperone [Intrasporangium flavum]|uniref:iron chaperone n=1 Tax=Intrasporangium flavum TaxID=1428657 RepID=UPI00096FD566|nr:DUF1801 domain-containing protein [Intrasporangium flavum]
MSTTTKRTGPAFTDDEKAAMKERANEVKASRRKGADPAEAKAQMLAKVAEMCDEDRALAEGVLALVEKAAPDLEPGTWYGMPSWSKGGKVVCSFQPAAKFKARYSTLGFNDPAMLDDGDVWPVAFAVLELTPAVEKQLTAVLRKAAG